jgi:hypothetical protein
MTQADMVMDARRRGESLCQQWPNLKGKVPSPSRRARDGEASTKPQCVVAIGFVEAARS